MKKILKLLNFVWVINKVVNKKTVEFSRTSLFVCRLNCYIRKFSLRRAGKWNVNFFLGNKLPKEMISVNMATGSGKTGCPVFESGFQSELDGFWRPLIERSETLRAIFRCHNSLWISRKERI